MNHLDEGTIHAWLDGALDATQARDIERHVGECDMCAAAVAEARGFVAASSRILNALDDVPAGVTPKRAAPQALRGRRMWRAAPWITGIAAAMMLAVGVTTWNRKGAEMASSTVRPAADAPLAQEVAVPATETRATAAGKRSVPADAAPPAQTKTRDAKVTGLAGGSSSPRVGAVTSARVKSQTETPAPAAPSAMADAPVVISRNRRPTMQRAPIPLRPFDSLGFRRSDAMAADQAAVVSAVEIAAGCYPVPRTAGDVAPQVGSVAGAVAEAIRAPDRAVRRAAKSATAPAPAPAAAASEFMVAKRIRMLHLDTTRHPLGYQVRSVPTDSTMGWWKPVGIDSVEVDMLSAGLFRFARKDRIACP